MRSSSYELETLRRSIVMLTPGQPAMKREQALELLSELSAVQDRLDRLRSGLIALVDQADGV